MAGVAGFEPTNAAVKCCVLPLDDTPIFTFLKLYLNKRKSAREISCRFRKWGG